MAGASLHTLLQAREEQAHDQKSRNHPRRHSRASQVA
jgi:hypothetical protein